MSDYKAPRQGPIDAGDLVPARLEQPVPDALGNEKGRARRRKE
jgi:hypothetical protein